MEKPILRQRKIQKTEATSGTGTDYSLDRPFVNDSLPNSVGYGLLFAFLILLRFFYIYENVLPQQLTIKEANQNPGRFIGERAELQLKRLISLGTRVVGSYENEVLAVDFLKREISFISQGANKIHKIEVDVQRPTGSYFLQFKPYGFRNYYANIQNIVVKLSSSNASESILLNCHYDTVPESPGASDNGLNCAVLLEILRVLSSSDVPLKNNIIFLFNGAEENPLQASHGFASQHKWRNEVKVVINLDSAGSGGKEILFQTSGEAWLVHMYAKAVPRPSAAVQAEELFQNGIIPSDTDFRVFRDFGNYSGLDFAHCLNGYVYHTKYDTMEFIRPGVYQFTGDNILALTKELAQSPDLGKTHKKTKLVYFDVFQLYLVSYSESVAFWVNFATAMVSLLSILCTLKALPDSSHSPFKNFVYSIGGSALALLLSAAVVFVIAKTLDLCNTTMSWYLASWLIIPLYVFPIILAMTAILLLMQTTMRRDSLGHKVIRFINGAKAFWTVILLLGTYFGIRSSFTIMLLILPMSIGSLFVTRLKKFSVKSYLKTQVGCLVLPVLYVLYQVIRVLTVIIPMTARMGPHTNPEIIIAALTFILSATFLGYFVPLLLLLRKLKSFLLALCIIHMLTMFGVVSTKYGFPYDSQSQEAPALQRFYIFHCERTFYDAKGSVRRADSGFFVQSLDRNNLKYVSRVLPELQNSHIVAEDCDTELYCGFPVFTSRFIRPAAYSAWIAAAPPTIHHSTSLDVLNRTQILLNVQRIWMQVKGPDHITFVLSPRPGVTVTKWSFHEPQQSQMWNDRPTYMVYYSHGLMGGTLEFYVDLEVSKVENADPILDVAVVGHYMHDKKYRTGEFNKFLSRFPDWTHVTAWTTTYKSWIL